MFTNTSTVIYGSFILTYSRQRPVVTSLHDMTLLSSAGVIKLFCEAGLGLGFVFFVFFKYAIQMIVFMSENKI